MGGGGGLGYEGHFGNYERHLYRAILASQINTQLANYMEIKVKVKHICGSFKGGLKKVKVEWGVVGSGGGWGYEGHFGNYEWHLYIVAVKTARNSNIVCLVNPCWTHHL